MVGFNASAGNVLIHVLLLCLPLSLTAAGCHAAGNKPSAVLEDSSHSENPPFPSSPDGMTQEQFAQVLGSSLHVSSSELTSLPLNENPLYIYRLFGRLPSQLSMTLVNRYQAQNWSSKGCQREIAAMPKPPKGGIVERHIEILRKGNQFEASLIADQFRYGACGWVYSWTGASIWASTSPPLSGSALEGLGLAGRAVIDASRYFVPGSVPQCNPRAKKCSEEEERRLRNSENTPVIVRCRKWHEKQGHSLRFSCEDMLYSYKTQYFLSPKSKQIEINVYDLPFDADPTADQPRE